MAGTKGSRGGRGGGGLTPGKGGPAKGRPAKPGSTKGNRAKSSGGSGDGFGGARQLTTRVKTAKGRRISSTRWLQRQLNDPYVEAAQKAGLRSRASFKLIQIDDRYRVLKPGQKVIDLGAAPGGWSLVAKERIGVDDEGVGGLVIAVDIAEMEAIPGVEVLLMDFMDEDADDRLIAMLGGERADVVMSDMAAPSTGHKQTDHLRIMGLCEAALAFARKVLAPGGVYLAKVLQGGTEGTLLTEMKRDFAVVRHVKPEASRSDSSELYVLAAGFRGGDATETDASADVTY